ncbi:MAG: nitrilase family protein [Bacteroidales bacterium]|nr:nitrilase family protein [Bacteroidales bacterium]
MQDITLTMFQADLAWEDKQTNLHRFSKKLQQIPSQTDVIVLPEMFTTAFVVEPEEYAETMDGPTMQWLKEQSVRYQAVVTGSLIVIEDGRYVNRMIWMKPDGHWDFYDKRHLFTFGGEHLRFSRGDSAPVFETRGWKFRPLICYDLRFPVWCKNHMLDGGYAYDVLIDVASWPDARRNAWNIFLASRAIENIAYAAGVNRVGRDPKGLNFSGDTAVFDPLGNPVAAAEPYKEAMLTATLSYRELSYVREHFAFGQDWDRFQIEISD